MSRRLVCAHVSTCYGEARPPLPPPCSVLVEKCCCVGSEAGHPLLRIPLFHRRRCRQGVSLFSYCRIAGLAENAAACCEVGLEPLRDNCLNPTCTTHAHLLREDTFSAGLRCRRLPVVLQYLKKYGKSAATLADPTWTTHSADAVANAVLDWGLDNNASVFTHIFQPLGASGVRSLTILPNN